MKAKEFKFHAENIGTSANSRGKMIVIADVNEEEFLKTISEKFSLKSLFYSGSYTIEEVMGEAMEHFGNEEVFNYVNGLGER